MAVSEWQVRRRVHFYEVDSAGIVHFSWFYRYMEEAECELWRAAGLSLTPDAELAYPRVTAAFDFKAPLRFDDEFDITIRVTALGRTSISYACGITRGETLIGRGSMTVVCVTGGAGRATPVPIPPAMRQALSP